MNTCPHCGSPNNTGVTYVCGTQYVGTETFQSTECQRIGAIVERVRHLEVAIRSIHPHVYSGRFATMTADEIISGSAS